MAKRRGWSILSGCECGCGCAGVQVPVAGGGPGQGNLRVGPQAPRKRYPHPAQPSPSVLPTGGDAACKPEARQLSRTQGVSSQSSRLECLTQTLLNPCKSPALTGCGVRFAVQVVRRSSVGRRAKHRARPTPTGRPTPRSSRKRRQTPPPPRAQRPRPRRW